MESKDRPTESYHEEISDMRYIQGNNDEVAGVISEELLLNASDPNLPAQVFFALILEVILLQRIP